MILYQIWCKRTYVSGGFCEGKDEPTQLIFTTLEKARSKIPKDNYCRENGLYPFGIDEEGIFYHYGHHIFKVERMSSEDILATDWKEV